MGAFIGDAAGAHVEFRRNVEAKDVEQGLKLEGEALLELERVK